MINPLNKKYIPYIILIIIAVVLFYNQNPFWATANPQNAFDNDQSTYATITASPHLYNKECASIGTTFTTKSVTTIDIKLTGTANYNNLDPAPSVYLTYNNAPTGLSSPFDSITLSSLDYVTLGTFTSDGQTKTFTQTIQVNKNINSAYIVICNPSNSNQDFTLQLYDVTINSVSGGGTITTTDTPTKTITTKNVTTKATTQVSGFFQSIQTILTDFINTIFGKK